MFKIKSQAEATIDYNSSSLFTFYHQMNGDHTLENKDKILIIDDNPDNLRLLSTSLSEQGYDVR